ncbi:probable cyclin-dependent serine/threonine-protein kinase DDB_G0292550 [Condylostylus longicornis]|uniref:probable cyclin-dependent serine/threonine-protein kinase DDB_G0292550 n=1 Tax=Condylostylus longicornis TaxID=2530218 RepID=UPI00244DDCB0|nr:probable cyclin-dependent serine/threonine-protein kinase DDB_G0292550 [Condylostylus longicornis]
MAIDFLILCLLLLSLTINVLALGAFWVTPGLRTTANRFVINLLIVNIIGCLALAPTLFLRSNSYSYETIDQTEIYKKLDHHQYHHQHQHEQHNNYYDNQIFHHHQFNLSNNNNTKIEEKYNDNIKNHSTTTSVTEENNDDININYSNNNNKNVAEEAICMGNLCKKIIINNSNNLDDSNTIKVLEENERRHEKNIIKIENAQRFKNYYHNKNKNNKNVNYKNSKITDNIDDSIDSSVNSKSFSSYEESYSNLASDTTIRDSKKGIGDDDVDTIDLDNIESDKSKIINDNENKMQYESKKNNDGKLEKQIIFLTEDDEKEIKNHKLQNYRKHYRDRKDKIISISESSPHNNDDVLLNSQASVKSHTNRITENHKNDKNNFENSQNGAENSNNFDDIDEYIVESNDDDRDYNLNNVNNLDYKNNKNLLHIQSDIRCWSLDLVAALGALSVLLIVGDTWCAVTDPLRYHSRISGLKAWLLIAIIWFFSILFGILSALRETTLTSETILRPKLKIHNNDNINDDNQNDTEIVNTEIYTTISTYLDGDFIENTTFHRKDGLTFEMIMFGHENLYNMIFSCIYFIVIILTPFILVCCMYWRIFSEARENGLRMRQNGSSPLLQSALNLAHHNNNMNQNKNHHYTHTKSNSHNHICINPLHSFNASTLHLNKDDYKMDEGLQMRIDHFNDDDNTTAKPSLLISGAVLNNNTSDNRNSISSNNNNNHNSSNNDSTEHSNRSSVSPDKSNNKDKNQNNILLTLSKANDELKRNYSTRQLALLDLDENEFEIGSNGINKIASNQLNRFASIRQVHSTPNLQKYNKENNESDDSLSDIDLNTNFNSIRHKNLNIIHNTNNVRHPFNRTQSSTHCNHQHALQLPPNIHQNTSTKALSYMTSIRHRLSNASSLFKYREESRAARISILVVIMFLVSYLPYGILVLLQGRIFSLSNHATQLAVFVVLLGNLSSPIIFAYRNKRVRRGVKRLFNLDSRAKDRQLHKRGIQISTSPSHHQQQQQNNHQKKKHQSSITGFFLRSSASNFHRNSSKNFCNNNNYNNSSSTNQNNNNNNNNNNIKKEKCGAKPSINITTNKMSAYTLNTCKFLSPSVAANAAGSLFIDLDKCNYLKKKKNVSLSTNGGSFIKISKVKRNSNKPIVQEEEEINEDNYVEELCDLTKQKIKYCNEINNDILIDNTLIGNIDKNNIVADGAGILHDPVKIIISDNSVANNFINNNNSNKNNSNCNSNSNINNEKRSILKIVCDSSRKLGCANGESCASSDCEIEPTDV